MRPYSLDTLKTQRYGGSVDMGKCPVGRKAGKGMVRDG